MPASTTTPTPGETSVIPASALKPWESNGRFIGPSSNAELQQWTDEAFADVELGRGDQLLLATIWQTAFDTAAQLAALVKRARLAERERTIAKLGKAGATSALLTAARAEGHAAGRAEAEAEHAAATAQRDRADEDARARRRAAWAELQA